MKVLVSGASGLVGSALCRLLGQQGYDVIQLVRQKAGQASSPNNIRWNPAKGLIDTEALEAAQVDAVIHLAGEPIVGLGWSEAKKAAIKNSRVQGTLVLANALAGLEHKPQSFISASAIGYYGHRGDTELSETADPGHAIHRQPRNRPFFLLDPQWGPDFLAATCQAWEEATLPAKAAGIRVVNMRLGIVLSKEGGALKAMLPAFMLGAAGPLGSGHQYMSWVSLDDAVGAFVHALNTPTLKGPVNVTAPNPVTNKVFTRQLSKRAFAIKPLAGLANSLPAPALALRLSPLGEMANALFLSSTRVRPVRLQETGYQFKHAQLDEALKATL
ncbi:MAG: TIGR01777 family oxidoreductase [Vampirovibrionales bacterium]